MDRIKFSIIRYADKLTAREFFDILKDLEFNPICLWDDGYDAVALEKEVTEPVAMQLLCLVNDNLGESEERTLFTVGNLEYELI
jgi:hypothetical protein